MDFDFDDALAKVGQLIDGVEAYLPIAAALGVPAASNAAAIVSAIGRTVDTLQARAADLDEARRATTQQGVLAVAQRLRALRKQTGEN